MRTPPVQIPNLIFFEVHPVNHPRPRLRLRLAALRFVLRRLYFLRRRVLQHQHQPVTTRRPCKTVPTLHRVRQLRRLAPFAIQNPHLLLALPLVIVAAAFLARRDKRQIFSVRTPPRMRRRFIFVRQRNRRPAANRNHPDPPPVLVFLQIRSLHRVRHPLPVRADLRIPHFLNPKKHPPPQNPGSPRPGSQSNSPPSPNSAPARRQQPPPTSPTTQSFSEI